MKQKHLNAQEVQFVSKIDKELLGNKVSKYSQITSF